MATKQKEVARDKPLPLLEFVKAKKRAGCPVCQLPVEVRGQLVSAREKKIQRADIIEWLKTEVGVEVTRAQMETHATGRHDL